MARLQPTGVFAEEKIELFALFFVLFFQLFVLLNGGKASILTFFILTVGWNVLFRGKGYMGF